MWDTKQFRLKGLFHYQPVTTSSDDGDSDGDFSSSPSILTQVQDGEEYSEKRSGRNMASLLLLGFSILVFILSLFYYLQRSANHVNDKICTSRMSAPSPALEAVEYQWMASTDMFQPDKYSGYPSKASEASWAELWDFGAFVVPLDSLAGLNKSSTTGDFRRVENGVGGLLEGAHQIHCLNLVRQFIYRDHWDYSQLPSFSGGEKTRRAHVDHCIATLRTVLTCNSDVTPYVMQRSKLSGKSVKKGFPHKCRVYSKLVDWTNSHSVFNTAE